MDPFVRGFKWFSYALGIFVVVGLVFGIIGRLIPEQRVVYIEKPVPEVVDPQVKDDPEEDDKWGDLADDPKNVWRGVFSMSDRKFGEFKNEFASLTRDLTPDEMMDMADDIHALTMSELEVSGGHLEVLQQNPAHPDRDRMEMEVRQKWKNAERLRDLTVVAWVEISARLTKAKSRVQSGSDLPV